MSKIAAVASKPPVAKPATTPASVARAAALAKPAVAKPPAANGKPVAATPVVEAKPAATNGKPIAATGKPVPANGKAAPTNGKPVAAPVEPPKPAVPGRPMLSQGPFVSTALTKKGTFAPNKLIVPPVKVRRPAPAPLALLAPAPPVPVVPSVPSGGKPQKNRAGMTPRDLDFFRDLLLAKRRELLGDMSSMEREALRESGGDLSTLPIHMADQGTDAYEQEFTLGLVEKDRTLLREINNALAKVQNGNYGICEGTGNPIGRPRLEAQPWAKYSIEHARVLEKRQMMFRR